MNTTTKNNIDTFEQFIHYSEEDELKNAAIKAGENAAIRQNENKVKVDQQEGEHEKKRNAKMADKAK